MRASDFSYELPDELIAQYPAEARRDSRLLVLRGGDGGLDDGRFRDFPGLLEPGDLLVLNDTRVMAARLTGVKPSGGRVEVLVERVLDDGRLLAHLRASRSPRPGTRLTLAGRVEAEVCGRRDDFFELRLDAGADIHGLLADAGQVPLPPYIRRDPEPTDVDRYQTVYAREEGAVAAPTAGLHFDESMLEEIRAAGIATAFITLHVGAGTFQPVRSEHIEDHVMHAERVVVSAEVCRRIAETRARGARVVAVGTTCVRALEAAAEEGGEVRPLDGETRLFIRPGYRFRCVDGLLTNFHLPESTLLMLVCAFAGREPVLAAYRHAVDRGYRFFSYGDAMFVTRAPS
jgi:S-adenosylmethionine:tRNA ribosyltransferase-isomerase